jgi:hypothetical protein
MRAKKTKSIQQVAAPVAAPVEIQSGLTLYPKVTDAAAQKHFAQSVPDPDSGSNNYLKEFLTITDGFLQTKRSFHFSDVAYQARQYSIPIEETKWLFDLWLNAMTVLCRVEVIAGCMDEVTINPL